MHFARYCSITHLRLRLGTHDSRQVSSGLAQHMTEIEELGGDGNEAGIGAFDAHLFSDVNLSFLVTVGLGRGQARRLGREADLGLGSVASFGVVAENEVHFVVLEAPYSANGETELGAQLQGGANRLERAQGEDDATFLQANVQADIGAQGRGEVMAGTGSRLPGRVGLAEGGSFEQSRRLGQRVGNEVEGGGERGPVEGRLAGEDEAQEIDALGEVGVKSVENPEMNGV